jgi:DNA end-binding protein Ku
MRAIWNGSLSFGLVNIPVRLYSASRERALNFRLLDKEDHCPISYKKVCRDDDKVVHQKDIVKGYEYEKGQYVVLEQQDFKKAAPKKTQTIDVLQFVEQSEIDPMYYDRPYWVEPDPKAHKAYALLREALTKSKKAGVARYVMHDREHIAILEPRGNTIMLMQMRYRDELREPDEVNVPGKEKQSDKEMRLALSLIDTLTEPFKPERFKDTYVEELKKVIEAKAKGKRITIDKEEAPPATSTADILKALQKSLGEAPEPLRKRKKHGTRRVQKKA